MTDVQPWRVFGVRVAALRRLSPSFLRVTFTGDDLDSFADNGYDQRFKLILPVPRHGLAHLPTGPDWYAAWRALPDERRNPVRTYTVRAVRPDERQVDVDMVLHPENGHGHGGPALRWASTARVGDLAALLGPDAGFTGDHGGVEFRPPPGVRSLLIAADETAVPAVAAILERLGPDAAGQALLEVPCAADALPLGAPPGVRVTWLTRDGGAPGSRLVPAVVAAAGSPPAVGGPPAVAPADEPGSSDESGVDEDLLWEVPDSGPVGESYAWLAGEAGVIRTLRRHLVGDRGWDRRSVAFMGYWRLGQAERTG
jgi:NADPH-dependent ferric siderophore reductase